jgi:type 1 fimbria pilin
MQSSNFLTVLGLFALAGVFLSGNAVGGTCTYVNSVRTIEFKLSQADVDAGAGTPIETKSLPSEMMLQCGAGPDANMTEEFAGSVPGGDGYFSLGNGLDMKIDMERVRQTLDGGALSSDYLDDEFGIDIPPYWSALGDEFTAFWYMATFSLRRSSGAAEPGDHIVPLGDLRSRYNTHRLQAKITIPKITCDVDFPKIVQLKPATTTEVTAAKTAEPIGSPTNFTVKYKCSAPMKHVLYTFRDNHRGGDENFFSLSPTSTASGIDLQMRDGQTLVRPGKSHTVSLSTPGKQRDEQFSITYVRNTSAVKPGTVRSSVTLTMDYD